MLSLQYHLYSKLMLIQRNFSAPVYFLASHILSLISRRICNDWTTKYNHPIHLLETFVDRTRFLGTCYRAANWILAGQTQGRSRNDRDRTIQAPPKDVYVYPLIKNFRKRLCYDAGRSSKYLSRWP